MKVLTHSDPGLGRQKRRSCLLARFRIVPLPGEDDRVARPARITLPSPVDDLVIGGTGRRKRRGDERNGVPSSQGFATSSGSSMWQAPGFSVRARRTALRVISGMLSGWSTDGRPLRDGLGTSPPRPSPGALSLWSRVGGALTGEHQHWRPVHIGVGDAGDEVGGARAEGTETAGRVSRSSGRRSRP